MNKLNALLATGRVSNLPTVVSNIFVAWVFSHNPSLSIFLLMCLSGSLIYVGGCFLGDARDLAFDKKHKPERPIPSGVLSAKMVQFLGKGMLFSGALIALIPNVGVLVTEISVFGLLFSVYFYALWHKSSAWVGLPLIGLCRGFLMLSSFAVFEKTLSPTAFLVATAVALYTICFALVARSESSHKKITIAKLLIAILILLGGSLFIISQDLALSTPWHYYLALIIYIIWTSIACASININKGRFVSFCLAGFALLDLTFVSAFGLLNMAICLALFILALTLQRITPAT